MTTRRHLFWIIPLAIVLVLGGAVLALPRFVASNAHRATIEALASSLTGRQVHVGGPLSLALLPEPRLIAADVTIGGPAAQVITARSLTLVIALPALLRGRLAARSLTLQSPHIVLPWPLPGGAATIVPPPWLAALHAQMTDATIGIGRLIFTGVNADIFTGGNGALSIAGSGVAEGTPLSLGLGLSAPDGAGAAALTIDSRSPDGKLGGHFSGVLQDSSTVAGQFNANFMLPGQAVPVAGTARLSADAGGITADAIKLTQGDATLTGHARLAFDAPSLALVLAGQNLAVAPLLPLLARTASLPVTLQLSVTDLRLPMATLPQVKATASFGAGGTVLRRLQAVLPGNGALDLTGRVDAGGNLAARASLSVADLDTLLAAFGHGVALPVDWRQLRLRANLAGDIDHLELGDLAGNLGASHVDGDLVMRRKGSGIVADGALHFDRLDLVPAVAMLRAATPFGGFSVAGEIAADNAFYGHLVLSHLLLDAALNQRLVVRRLAASLYGGGGIASFTLAADGRLTAARALLAVPSAAPLVALLPASLLPPGVLPAVLAEAPLSLSVAAAGTPGDLATSAVASLGAISVTAAPVLDLIRDTAAGPLTLRHPDAIAALAPFGVDAGLAWPGAGSIALRADVSVSPAQYGLPDFVLSFGDLTANGRVMVTADGHVSATIAADTLALPPLPATLTVPWDRLTGAQGRIDLAADRVWLGGREIAGAAAATMVLAPASIGVTLRRASLGDGTLSGALTANLAGTPALGLNLALANADAGGFALPVAFPYTLPAGTIAGQAALTASGFSAAAWAATLGGSASLDAVNGQLAGFSLGGAAKPAAAKSGKPTAPAAPPALISNFTHLGIAGSFAHGIFTLQNAALQGPDGSAAATGSIDIPDQSLALQITLSPKLTPPAATTLTSVGPWTAPKQILAPAH